MKLQEQTQDVGVIVGRFQVNELHEAHLDLIKTVCSRHEKVIIFLGLSPLRVTTENPLDFESRKQMILQKFPEVIVLYAKDSASDQVWSRRLDAMIADVVSPGQTVVLYGSRDSFIAKYHGAYDTQELVQEVYVSGKEIRKAISKKVKASPEFRAGVIWASHSRYPTVYPTVDVAVLNEDETKILLARKEDEREYRFIGGFVDPRDANFEAAARREVQEEACIAITDPVYVGNFSIDDWRYRTERDCIKSTLFKARIFSGSPGLPMISWSFAGSMCPRSS
jgi:bifunctional NMN adenylyltransferase/nudix hydrolase